MTPAYALRTSAFGFLVGVALASFIPMMWTVDALLLLSIAIGVFLCSFVIPSRARIAILFFVFLLVGIARLTDGLPMHTEERVRAEGIVQNTTRTRFGKSDIVVAFDRERVLLSQVSGSWVYGDAVRVTCIPALIEGRDRAPIDFRLAAQGIFFTCAKSTVQLIDHNRGNPILHFLYRVRDSMERIAARYLPEPHASVFSGILFGTQGKVPRDLTRAFTTTGLIHLLVVSGSHMVLMGEYLGLLFLAFGLYPRTRGALTLLVLFLFIAAIGFPASAVRGFWFAVLLVAARMLGRTRVMTTALVGTAGVMVAWNPFLIRDLGFQLSFLATVGVAIVAPLLETYMERCVTFVRAWRGVPPERRRKRNDWWNVVVWRPFAHFLSNTTYATLGAILMTAPLVATTFGQFSLVAPLANILVVGWIVPLMFLGVALILFAWVPPVAFIIAIASAAILGFITAIVRFLAAIPFAQIMMPASWVVGGIIYIFLFVWIRNSSRSLVRG